MLSISSQATSVQCHQEPSDHAASTQCKHWSQQSAGDVPHWQHAGGSCHGESVRLPQTESTTHSTQWDT